MKHTPPLHDLKKAIPSNAASAADDSRSRVMICRFRWGDILAARLAERIAVSTTEDGNFSGPSRSLLGCSTILR